MEYPLSTPLASNISGGKIKKFLLDSLFPIFCVSCQSEGSWLCEKCLSQTKVSDIQFCPACEKIETKKGAPCRGCQNIRQFPLDGLVTATSYENPVVKKLVHNLKYRFISDMSDPLATLISKTLFRFDVPLPDFLVPIPLHRIRLRWRGFNQSSLIATHVSRQIAPHLKIEVLDILERLRHNQPQMEIKNYELRRKNIKDNFGIKSNGEGEKILGKTILLIDDIATTGATLEECAKTLKSAGARKVFAAVIARQSLKK